MLFNPAEEYDAKSVLLVSLSDTPITLTAQQVTSMPWRQFVRLMKVCIYLSVKVCIHVQRTSPVRMLPLFRA